MNKAIADYFKTQPIQRAWIFGSFARGEETPLSDVDLLVQYSEGGISLLKHCAMSTGWKNRRIRRRLSVLRPKYS